jgi:hypothetical protein
MMADAFLNLKDSILNKSNACADIYYGIIEGLSDHLKLDSLEEYQTNWLRKKFARDPSLPNKIKELFKVFVLAKISPDGFLKDLVNQFSKETLAAKKLEDKEQKEVLNYWGYIVMKFEL